MKREQLAARLLATFVAELAEQLTVANTHLLALERDRQNADELRGLFRVMHTLKGAARVAGVPSVESVCHELESLLADVRDGRGMLGDAELAALFAGVDTLGAAARALHASTPAEPAVVPPSATSEPGRGGDAQTGERRATPRARLEDTDAGGALVDAPAVAPGAGAVGPAVVRVSSDRVDALLNVSTLLLTRSAEVSMHADAVQEVGETLARAGGAWRQLRAVLRREAAHGDESSSGDRVDAQVHHLDELLTALQRDVARLASGSASTSRALVTATADIGRGVRELRLRPFREAVEALPRAVRDLAAATGKEVRIEISGHEVEMDRAVLEDVRDALLHLVRNAVDHGIESPEARVARGKPREGVLRVRAGLASDHVFVTMEDDGAGIDIAAVRRELAARDIEPPTSDREVVRLLFQGGVSTRAEAGAISGRGVGLDAVQAAMQRARGSVDVEWTRGAGTRFVLEAPLTFASMRALLVRTGGHVAAVPTAFVERLMRLHVDAVRSAGGRAMIETDAAPVPVVPLARVLGPPLAERAAERVAPVLLLRAGGRRLAVSVEELLGEQELVVRPIVGRGHGSLPHLTGAALLADGTVALVLNATAVVASGLGAEPGRIFADAAAGDAGGTAHARRRRVLVVDDSITTRTLEQSVLEAAGYDVEIAVDGADAWRVLQERGAELVVSDVEMPRMDGFALCAAMRASARLRAVPVILVTALESPEDRARGLEIGADAYLGKSSFDQGGLLETVRQLLA